MLQTSLTDEFDSTAVRLLYDKWKGIPVNPSQFKLAIENLVGYGIFLAPDGIFSAKAPQELTDEECEARFQQAMAPRAGVDKIGDGTLIKLLGPILLKFLAGLLL